MVPFGRTTSIVANSAGDAPVSTTRTRSFCPAVVALYVQQSISGLLAMSPCAGVAAPATIAGQLSGLLSRWIWIR